MLALPFLARETEVNLMLTSEAAVKMKGIKVCEVVVQLEVLYSQCCALAFRLMVPA